MRTATPTLVASVENEPRTLVSKVNVGAMRGPGHPPHAWSENAQ
jgi:hypothetical protein